MSTTTKYSRIKVVWCAQWPNNIQLDLCEAIAKDPNIDLVMIVSDLSKPWWESKGYRTIGLPERHLYPWIFLPHRLLALITKTKDQIPTLFSLEELKKTLHIEKPDVVVLNLEYIPATWDGAEWCQERNIPYIIQVEMHAFSRNILTRIATECFIRFKRNLFARASALITWSDRGNRFVRKQFSVETAVHTIPAAIDIKQFTGTIRKKTGPLRVLCVARYVPYKRHKDIIDAATILQKRGIDIIVSFVGKGPLEKELRARKKKLKAPVQFIKGASFTKMRKLYSQHDCIVLASRNEAIGMVVPEAMACGLPAIISDTTGASTYVRDGIDGIQYPTGNVNALANAIEKLTDNSIRTRMARNAQKHIREVYNQEAIAKKYINLIAKLATKRRNHT